MFKNIGSKIMGLAKFNCWLGIILSVIIGAVWIITAVSNPDLLNIPIPNALQPTAGSSNVVSSSIALGTVGGVIGGVLIIVLGSLLSWIGSWLLYGFGKLVDNSDRR